MDKSERVVITCVLVAIVVVLFIALNPFGRGLWNTWIGHVQSVDDRTSYATQKQVEDSCRSMIASYTSDVLVYEQYKNSEDKDQRSWAEQAKMRANKTAASYNEYILKNSYVWENNVPSDIRTSIPYIE